MTNFRPHIGKNVIETLTLGMYEDARFIYREYVQNAADQIDEAYEKEIIDKKSDGKIKVTIDKDQKTISIEDNATGIEGKNVLKFLGDVANSQKDPKLRKGFRGIGRLGGLGYCERLIFETSYKGENSKNTITLNALLLKSILENKEDVRDASEVINAITTFKSEAEGNELHYFKVILVNVTKEELFHIQSVQEYLSMVAPVPYEPKFDFKEKIYSYYKENKIHIDEYDVQVSINNVQLYKPYKSKFIKKDRTFSQLIDVQCFQIWNENDVIIGIGWYGITDKLNYQIPTENVERGIRLRKGNIGIGNEYTLSTLFGQSRQNLNYIGEVHAIGEGFTPNARRDYFNDSRTVTQFENKLNKLFSRLGAITQESSKLHNRKKDIINFQIESEEFNTKSQSGQLTQRELDSSKTDLQRTKERALKAANEIEKVKQKTYDESLLKMIYSHIIGDLDVVIDDSEFDFESDDFTYDIDLSSLDDDKKSVITEIFDILENALPLSTAEMLKKKIVEHYNR